MRRLFDQFVRERKYIENVSPATVEWYERAWKAWSGELPGELRMLTPAVLKQAVIALRERGLKPVSVNSYCRVLNAWLRWLRENGHVTLELKIKPQKEERYVPPTFTVEQVRQILKGKTIGVNMRRVQVLAATLVDTGIRITEALTLYRHQIDWDNLLIRVFGKGRKERLVPMSMELRRILFRWLQTHQHDYVFATCNGTPLSRRNAQRDLAKYCRELGISGTRSSPHTFRHTFATNYIRQGGDIFRLQRVLGHTSLEMVRRYVSLQTEDLQAVHGRLTLLRQGS